MSQTASVFITMHDIIDCCSGRGDQDDYRCPAWHIWKKKETAKKLRAPEKRPALPLPARTALPCSWYTTGRRLAPPVISSHLYSLCYLEAGHTAPLQGSFPCEEIFWGLFNLFGAATQGGKQCVQVYFLYLSCAGLPWPSDSLGNSGGWTPAFKSLVVFRKK